jgi:hypothetical protein
MDLQWFDTTYTTTIYTDSGISASSASPTSGTVAKGATVTVSLTFASGYELDAIDVVSGGVTVTVGDSITFKMGEANVVLNAKSKKSAVYMVTENTPYSINGANGSLTKNTAFRFGPNGDIIEVTCTGSDLSSMNSAVLEALLKSGVIVKM